VIEHQNKVLSDVQASQIQLIKNLSFHELLRQQSQLMGSIQQNQLSVMKAFQDYQSMVFFFFLFDVSI